MAIVAGASANGGGFTTSLARRLEDTARNLGRVASWAGESVKRMRVEEAALIVKRSPLAALGVAMGIGLLVGLSLWGRTE